MEQKDVLNAIENGTFYDFVANEYWQLTHHDLAELLKECAFLLTPSQEKELAENIIDREIML